MAIKTAAFHNAGQAIGVEVYRVENFKLVPIEEEKYNCFFSGDSYVVLNTKKAGGGKSHDIHFWLGANTSLDESAAAALYATELDEALGGEAKQYRHVQGFESPEFLQIFKGGLHIREGGIKSGFRHVENQIPEPALLCITGKEHTRVIEVPMSVDSLNSSDMFILDLFDKLFLWSGKGANIQEKARSREVLMAMKEARKGQPEVVYVEEAAVDNAAAGFYATLGAEDPNNVVIKPASPDHVLEDGEAFGEPQLYKISDDSTDGGLMVTKIIESSLARTHLESASAYVLAADGWLFVWQGKNVSSAERKASLSTAHKLLQQLNLPHNTPVQLVKDGFEEPTFKQHFDWSLQSTAAPAMSSSKTSEIPGTPLPPAGRQDPSLSSTSGKLADAPHLLDKPRTDDTNASKDSLTPTDSTPEASKADDKVAAKSSASKKAAREGMPASSPGKEGSKAGPTAEPANIPRTAETANTPKQHSTPVERPPAFSSGPTGNSGDAASPTGKVTFQADDRTPTKAPAQQNGIGKPKSTPGRLAVPKVTDFIPKPQVDGLAEPSMPPKPTENLKFQPDSNTFSYQELKEMRPDSGIDMTCKEGYLSAEEFQKVFGKSVSDFRAQPKWRQLQAKKAVGLF